MSKKKDIILARCPGKSIGMENVGKFSEVLKQQLPPSDYIVFIDADSDTFELELVSKPIVINSDDMNDELEKLESLLDEIREKHLKDT